MSNFNKVGVPFYLEVYIDDDQQYDAGTLKNIIVDKLDIIPGLKVDKAFSLGCSQDSMICQELEDDLNSLVEHVNKITEKYGNFQEDNMIDMMMTELGEEPDDFGKYHRERALDIQRLIQNRDEIGLTKDGHYVKRKKDNSVDD